MMKICVYAVKDCYGDVQEILADRHEAVALAIEEESIPSFESWLSDWMSNNEAVDLLEILKLPNPYEALISQYETWIDESIDNGNIDGIEKYEVDIPLSALDISELSPEIVQIIANIFVN
jgi:hypothetical protein